VAELEHDWWISSKAEIIRCKLKKRSFENQIKNSKLTPLHLLCVMLETNVIFWRSNTVFQTYVVGVNCKNSKIDSIQSFCA
jgi:hypothetical protein